MPLHAQCELFVLQTSASCWHVYYYKAVLLLHCTAVEAHYWPRPMLCQCSSPVARQQH